MNGSWKKLQQRQQDQRDIYVYIYMRLNSMNAFMKATTKIERSTGKGACVGACHQKTNKEKHEKPKKPKKPKKP